MDMHRTALAVCAALLLAACGDNSSGDIHGTLFRHIRIIDGDHIALMPRDHAPGASLASDGSLKIGGKAVALTPDQQTLTRAYFTEAMQLRDDSIAIGKAGAAVASQALGAVAEGIASGHPDKIGPKIDAKAAKVEAQAKTVCDDLGKLKSAQDAVAAKLPSFSPYASIEAAEVAHCSED